MPNPMHFPGKEGTISIVKTSRHTAKAMHERLQTCSLCKSFRYIDDVHQPYFVVQT